MADPPLNPVGLLAVAATILERLGRDDETPRDGQHPAAFGPRRNLQNIAKAMAQDPDSRATRKSVDWRLAALSCLTRLCDQKFVSYTYSSIPVIWRILYVDAQLLKAICILGCQSTASNSHQQRDTLQCGIRDLDLALIVAGAASLSKEQACHDLILALQNRLRKLESQGQPCPFRQPRAANDRKRRRVSDSHPVRVQPNSKTQADRHVPEYSFVQAPSFEDLASPHPSHGSRPFIVRSFAQRTGWRAVQSPAATSHDSSWSSKDYLLRLAGPARVVPVEVGANYARQDWGQDMMLWSQFLELCEWDHPASPTSYRTAGASHSRLILYMAQHDLVAQFPALENDFTLPDYVFMAPQAPRDWPQYQPPASPNGVVTNLWVGPAGTVSPPHFDPYFNCFVQVVGYKEVWVAPPGCRPVARSQATKSITETLMANTADIDVFDDQLAVADPIRASAFKAVLGPGDLLFMPPGWWHSLRSLSRSFSVSMWF